MSSLSVILLTLATLAAAGGQLFESLSYAAMFGILLILAGLYLITT